MHDAARRQKQDLRPFANGKEGAGEGGCFRHPRRCTVPAPRSLREGPFCEGRGRELDILLCSYALVSPQYPWPVPSHCTTKWGLRKRGERFTIPSLRTPLVSRVEGSSSQVSPVHQEGNFLMSLCHFQSRLLAERRMTERDSHRVVLQNIRIIMKVLGKLLRSDVSQDIQRTTGNKFPDDAVSNLIWQWTGVILAR